MRAAIAQDEFLKHDTAQMSEAEIMAALERPGVAAAMAVVSGTVKDLTGRSSPLSFKQITAQGAVYYIAQFKIDQPETVTFDLNIETGGISNSLRFNQEVFPGE